MARNQEVATEKKKKTTADIIGSSSHVLQSLTVYRRLQGRNIENREINVSWCHIRPCVCVI